MICGGSGLFVVVQTDGSTLLGVATPTTIYPTPTTPLSHPPSTHHVPGVQQPPRLQRVLPLRRGADVHVHPLLALVRIGARGARVGQQHAPQLVPALADADQDRRAAAVGLHAREDLGEAGGGGVADADDGAGGGLGAGAKAGLEAGGWWW